MEGVGVRVDWAPRLAYWVGVRLDEPVGDNDGKVRGKLIFECAPGFGKFLRPQELKVGDYPEIDEFDMDDDML